jgi:hypothetical protein
MDKFSGVGYPDLDKLATHELTLTGCLPASAVLSAKMASFSHVTDRRASTS